LGKNDWRGLFIYSTLGIEVGTAVGIGAVIGYFLDKRFNTQPWLLLLFMLFGIAAAVKAVWREVKKYQQESGNKGPGNEGPQ
jgi:ATP synthase protein I